MVPTFLIPETVITGDGESKPLGIGCVDSLLVLTLGVLKVVEQESLLISLEGSVDGTVWAPMADFPQRFYNGISALVVRAAEFRYLRARWKTARWGRGDHKPYFRVYLFVEQLNDLILPRQSTGTT